MGHGDGGDGGIGLGGIGPWELDLVELGDSQTWAGTRTWCFPRPGLRLGTGPW